MTRIVVDKTIHHTKQPLWPSSLRKGDLLRFRCSSGHVLSKTKSVTPHYLNISDNSSFNGKIFGKKKSMSENFRVNVIKIVNCEHLKGK